MTQDYRIVSGELHTIQAAVRGMIAQGWRPLGGASCMDRDGHAICTQAMIRDVKLGPSEVKDVDSNR